MEQGDCGGQYDPGMKQPAGTGDGVLLQAAVDYRCD